MERESSMETLRSGPVPRQASRDPASQRRAEIGRIRQAWTSSTRMGAPSANRVIPTFPGSYRWGDRVAIRSLAKTSIRLLSMKIRSHGR